MAIASPQAALAAYKVKKRNELREQSYGKYSNEPVAWIEERAKGYMYSKLRDIAYSVRDNRRTAVPSCHDAGKSWLSARLACWWIDSRPPGTAFVVTTAPTSKQVRSILWKEMHRVYVTANLNGRMNQTEWWINNEMIAMGRKPSNYDPTAFQGIHAREVLLLLDEACHDKETEVLTKEGWKSWQDVTINDEFLSMNPDTMIAEYVKPLQIVSKLYTGKMLQYTSRNANFCVTPDHRMFNSLYSRGIFNKWKFNEMEDLKDKWNRYLRHDINWDEKDDELFNIPSYKNNPPIVIDKGAWIAFLGWYCSEGSLGKQDGIAYTIRIAQQHDYNRQEIAELCEALRFSYTVSGNDVIVNSRQIAVYLEQFGKNCLEKRIPDEVRFSSIENINMFLDIYVRGDGYTKTKDRDIIYTSSPRMAADLQELILKTGCDSTVRNRKLAGRQSDFGTHIAISSVDGFVVSRSRYNTCVKLRSENIKEVDYNDTVYCATLEKYGLLLTRRDGYALWSGNCGVTEDIYIAGNSLIANEFGRILAIGNPDDPDSHFAKVCSPDSGWVVIPISAFDTPNFTGEAAPQAVKDVLVSPIYVQEMIKDVGEDSAVYTSKILGQFPTNKVDGVIPLSWITQCQDDEEYEEEDLLPIELGVDVGAGGDETSIRERRGIVAGGYAEAKTPNPEDAFYLVVDAIMESGATRVKIDVIGIGWALIGMLRQAIARGAYVDETTGRSIDISFTSIVGVNVGVHSTDPARFPRLRDQLWWEVGRELSRTKGWNLSNLDDLTIAQLIAPTWRTDLANRHRVETKQETMKRTSRPSPNRADALLLAFCEPPSDEEHTLVIYEDQVEIGPQY